MHAVVHAQDYYNTEYPHEEVPIADWKFFFQNYEIYIGNDSSYMNNKKCAGGPFLHQDDPNSYVFDQYAYDNDSHALIHNPYNQGAGMVWPFGKENWCNLEGRYMHMVADHSI